MPPFRLPWRTRPQVTSDVEEELRYHLDLVAARLRAGGLSESEARAEAERQFGDLEAEWGVSGSNRRVKTYQITPVGRKQLKSDIADLRRYVAALFAVLEPA